MPRISLLALLLLALPLAACDSSDPDPQLQTITDLAIDTPSLSTLVTALTTANLGDALRADGPFTVFAPSNDAFGEVNGDLLNAILGDNTQLTDLLRYHVVPGRFAAADLSDGQMLTTLEGERLEVTITGGNVFVDGVQVQTPNVEASNGIVHVIGGVLIDPIDIVDAASLLGFSTLVQAAIDTNLDDDLMGEGPLTVFAPTNDAFTAAGAGSLSANQVRNILLYHVVPTFALSGDLSNGQTVPTLKSDETLGIGISGNTITIDGAQSDATVGPADIVVGNGVIHAIDTVLLPATF
ncbi:MAG: fasciclin domain-containing protein [Bacteroidota bacterium]